jgi:exodeoxyribonuclease V alpha subunit
VFNGDIGVIKTIDLEDSVVKIQFDDREVDYEFSDLDEIALAYAPAFINRKVLNTR